MDDSLDIGHGASLEKTNAKFWTGNNQQWVCQQAICVFIAGT